jgi:lipoyl(octanoyl) transferase
VVYPIFDLEYFFRDIHKYVRFLEEIVIRTLAEYNIEATRQKGFTGVWILDNYGPSRKICAIGVHLSRWVTLHGLAFNINSNLSHFNNIIPCGIDAGDKTVTSLEKELGKKVDMEEVKMKIKSHFASLFKYKYV